MTYSIVAHDRVTGDLGMAVASRFLATGAVNTHGAAGLGIFTLQSYLTPAYGPALWHALAQGLGAQDALDHVVEADADPSARQVGLVDRAGAAATYTGPRALHYAGGFTGSGYAVQGNMLVGRGVLDAMAAYFESADGDLADRVTAALRAGCDAGGDARGKQAAALLVLRRGGGFLGLSDRLFDLRVDDHADPVRELSRLLEKHRTHNLLWVDAAAASGAGDVETATRALEAAYAREPDDTNVVYFLARSYAAAGRHAPARELLNVLQARVPTIAGFAAGDEHLSSLVDASRGTG